MTSKKKDVKAKGRNARKSDSTAATTRECPACQGSGRLPQRLQPRTTLELKRIAEADGVEMTVSGVSRLFSGRPERLKQFRRMKAVADAMQITMDELYAIVATD